jgi:hypothetical protein
MLVADLDQRGTGVGRALLDFAEWRGESHPHLAPLLATPCDLEVYGKPLQVHARS